MKVNLSGSNHLNQINLSKVNESEVNEKPGKRTFAQMLVDAVNQVNQKQHAADEISRQFAAGEIDDLHQVMIAVEEAKLSMQFLVQVRNKMIEAYQEISRMQI